MYKKSLHSFLELLNISQQLRELDPIIHDDPQSLGIYSREFQLTPKR